MNFRLLSVGLVVVLSACSEEAADTAATTQASVEAVRCERECLEDTIENYLQALAAQDVTRIKVTDDLVFSENNQVLALGDGSWQTMTGTGSYRHYFADPQTSQVAVISTMRENDQGIIYDLRLRLEGDRISEIESMVIRTPGGAELYETLGAPPPNFQEIIPAAQRNTREELLAIPYQYLKGMENNDPHGDYSFFDPECNRYEHALKTTNSEPKNVGHTESTTFSTMTCEAQFSGGGLAFVTRIRDERYNSTMVVDEEKQAVFGFVFLDHNGTVRSTTRADGSQSGPIPPYFSTPRSLKVGEGWRVRDNKLFEIEMTLTEVPYGTRPHFGLAEEDDTWLQSQNINPNNIRIATDCDLACLDAVTESFLNALLTHDHSKLALSPNIQYRENGIRLAVGDGLWGSTTALNDYQVFLSDPSSSVAGFLGTITETDVPGLLSARLNIEDGLIQEIDVTVSRLEYNTARGGTLSLFYPQVDKMFAVENFTAADASFSMAGNSSLDELIAQSTSFASTGRDSKILIADAAKGLVLEQNIVDVLNATAEQRDARSSGSYSILTTNLYRTEANALVLDKSVNQAIPYKTPF